MQKEERMMYALMQSAKIKLGMFANRFIKDESGDTNFISILIVLGIVIVLVVFFQGQITTILNAVKAQVCTFTQFSAGT